MFRFLLIAISLLSISCSSFLSKIGPVRPKEPVLQRGWAYTESSKEHADTVESNVQPLDFSSPTLEGEKIILSTSRLGLMVIAKESGQLLWKRNFKGEHFSTKPLVVNNKIIVGTDEGFVRSFQLDTGVEIWKAELPSGVRCAPILALDRIVLTTADEAVHALDPATGKLLWTYRRPSYSGTSIYGSGNPALIGGKIWIGFSEGTLVSLEPNDGSLLLEKSFRDNLKFNDIDAKPLAWKEHIIFPTYDGKLRMIKKDGTLVWETQAGASRSPVVSTSHGNSLLYSSSDGAVYLVEIESGKEIWHYNLSRGVPTGAVVYEANDKSYAIVASSDQYIYALDMKDGKELARVSLGRGSGAYATLAIDAKSKSVFVLSQFSRLYQLRVN